MTPQHHGSHVEARWAELIDEQGHGIRLVLGGSGSEQRLPCDEPAWPGLS